MAGARAGVEPPRPSVIRTTPYAFCASSPGSPPISLVETGDSIGFSEGDPMKLPLVLDVRTGTWSLGGEAHELPASTSAAPASGTTATRDATGDRLEPEGSTSSLPHGMPLSSAVAVAPSRQRPAVARGLQQTASPSWLPGNAPSLPPTQRYGSRGPHVLDLQQRLRNAGHDPGPVDGLFGPRTEAAVQSYQRSRGLAVDGVVGRQTWGALGRTSSSSSGHAAPPPAVPAAPQNPPSSTSTPSGTHARLSEQYSSHGGYNAVRSAVRRFYPPDRDNGCVAYMSEALRQVGVPVPKTADASGSSISLVTKPFSNYLEHQLGWQRITSAADLRPGDVCFTRDNPSHPGYPAHTFMFQGWKDQARGIAWVVDNQDNVHPRNIHVDDFGNYNFTPFRYALRSPNG